MSRAIRFRQRQQIRAQKKSSVNSQIYGNGLGLKTDDILRIGLQNFGGFTNRFDDPVNASLKQWITNKEFNIFGITETNVFWPKITEKLQFHNPIKEWWNPNLTKGNFAHNQWENSNDVKHWGGVAQISHNQASL